MNERKFTNFLQIHKKDKSPKSLFRKQTAFSLMEMLIVMAIIGILAATTVMGINSLLPHWQLSGSARLLTNKLRQAQEEAVTTQKQHLIRFSPAASPVTYQMIKIDGGEQIMETITMPNNITVGLDATITDNQIIFSADGGPSSNGNITITLGEANKTINITPAGVIKLQ